MTRIWTALLSLGTVLGLAIAGYGQEAAPSPYFDCPYVNYFDRDCPQLWEEQERRRSQQEGRPATLPPDQDAPPQGEQAERQDDRPDDLDGDETYLLFPRESLAPDAPPLFRLLLAEPTLENARRYVGWYARRAARLQAVQALIRQAGSELESESR